MKALKQMMGSSRPAPNAPQQQAPPSSAQQPRPQQHGTLVPLLQGYTQLKQLGSGAASKAYLARGTADGQHYVIKQVQCIGGKYNSGVASYILQECRLLFQLKHPNIVEMKDFYPQKDNMNLVLEFCDNGDLGVVTYKAIKAKTPIPKEQVTSWFFQVMLAVAFMHRNNVMHRDLKPQNVLLRGDEIKIADFGLAKVFTDADYTSSTRVGTLMHMAPEVKAKSPYTEKADIWSVGTIFYQMITLINLQFKDPGKFDLSKLPHGGLNDVIRAMLNENPASRPSANDVLQMSMTPYLQPLAERAMRAEAQRGQHDAITCPGLPDMCPSCSHDITRSLGRALVMWAQGAFPHQRGKPQPGLNQSLGLPGVAPGQPQQPQLHGARPPPQQQPQAMQPKSGGVPMRGGPSHSPMRGGPPHSPTPPFPGQVANAPDLGPPFGITLGKDRFGNVVVAKIARGCQADLDEIVKVGDRVEEVAGRGIFGMEPLEVEAQMRAAPTRSVELVLFENASQQLHTIALSRTFDEEALAGTGVPLNSTAPIDTTFGGEQSGLGAASRTLGIDLEQRPGQGVVIRKVVPDSAASGMVEVGDTVCEVNGADVSLWSLGRIADRLRNTPVDQLEMGVRSEWAPEVVHRVRFSGGPKAYVDDPYAVSSSSVTRRHDIGGVDRFRADGGGSRADASGSRFDRQFGLRDDHAPRFYPSSARTGLDDIGSDRDRDLDRDRDRDRDRFGYDNRDLRSDLRSDREFLRERDYLSGDDILRGDRDRDYLRDRDTLHGIGGDRDRDPLRPDYLGSGGIDLDRDRDRDRDRDILGRRDLLSDPGVRDYALGIDRDHGDRDLDRSPLSGASRFDPTFDRDRDRDRDYLSRDIRDRDRDAIIDRDTTDPLEMQRERERERDDVLASLRRERDTDDMIRREREREQGRVGSPDNDKLDRSKSPHAGGDASVTSPGIDDNGNANVVFQAQLGIVLRTNENQDVWISSVVNEGPVSYAGGSVGVGDIVVEVDGAVVKGWSAAAVSAALDGVVGSGVELVLRRDPAMSDGTTPMGTRNVVLRREAVMRDEVQT